MKAGFVDGGVGASGVREENEKNMGKRVNVAPSVSPTLETSSWAKAFLAFGLQMVFEGVLEESVGLKRGMVGSGNHSGLD